MGRVSAIRDILGFLAVVAACLLALPGLEASRADTADAAPLEAAGSVCDAPAESHEASAKLPAFVYAPVSGAVANSSDSVRPTSLNNAGYHYGPSRPVIDPLLLQFESERLR